MGRRRQAGAEASRATDECALVEAIGAPVTLVPGEPGNFKITGAEDVKRARAALEAPVAMGVGYDTHRFAAGRRLVLGGVEFEGDGLLGHSDADVCAHAIGDAILGAAGAGVYEIDDGTGKIYVATEKYGVPSKDTYVGVTGRVVPGVTWGGRNYGNGMHETRRRTRENR